MSKSLMEMTVKEFREEFRKEFKNDFHEKYGENADGKKLSKNKLTAPLIADTSWGKAHRKVIKEDIDGAGIITLFFLNLIGVEIDIEEKIFKVAKIAQDIKECDRIKGFKEIFGSEDHNTSNVFNRLLTNFAKDPKHPNKDELEKIDDFIKLIDNTQKYSEDLKVGQHAIMYALDYLKVVDGDKDFVENEDINQAYDNFKKSKDQNGNEIDLGDYKGLKLFLGVNKDKDYLEKLEERRIKMTKTYKAIKDEIKENIEAGVKQIILTGAPGTGKSRMAREIAEELSVDLDLDLKNLKKKLDDQTKDEKEKKEQKKELKKKFQEYIEFVQFHPSYDYTDFVEGIRPVEEPEKDGVGFRKVNGIFKQFCQQVVEKNEEEKNEEKKYFFIIDEINRADLSKVFGELMYCLESDKRGDQFEIKTQYQNMKTYKYETEKDNATGKYKIVPMENDKFGAGFFIPKNVYIIGTMNDIDRSVESMDFALRRRFMWKEIEVTQDLLIEALGKLFEEYNNNQSNAGNKLDANELAKKIESLNETIRIKGKDFGLNEHYFISQGQFANLPQHSQFDSQDDTEKIVNKICQYVWNNRLKSLLFEYVRGEDGAADFVKTCAKNFGVSNE